MYRFHRDRTHSLSGEAPALTKIKQKIPRNARTPPKTSAQHRRFRGRVGCEGSLFSRLYNTKPVSFILCSGERFTAELGAGATPVTTTYFRIQEIKGNCVILQLIDFSGEAPVCSTNTVVLDLECTCGIQCYAPITCTLCNDCGN